MRASSYSCSSSFSEVSCAAMSSMATSVSITSAIPVGFRSRVPLKMTSYIFPPRRFLADCSPSTHDMASAILLFPQPLGPTTPVMPSPKTREVRSAKDLKPIISSFSSLNIHAPWLARPQHNRVMIKFWHTIEYRVRASQILIDGETGRGRERERERERDKVYYFLFDIFYLRLPAICH